MDEKYPLEFAARLLGITEKTLKARIERLGIKIERDPADRRRYLISDEDMDKLRKRNAGFIEVRRQVEALHTLTSQTARALEGLEADDFATDDSPAMKHLTDSIKALTAAAQKHDRVLQNMTRRVSQIEAEGELERRELREALDDCKRAVDKLTDHLLQRDHLTGSQTTDTRYPDVESEAERREAVAGIGR